MTIELRDEIDRKSEDIPANSKAQKVTLMQDDKKELENISVIIFAIIVLFLAFDALGTMDWFYDGSVRSGFYRSTFVMFCSLTLGIPFGLHLNNKWQSQKVKIKRKNMLLSLAATFERNQRLLESISKRLKCGLHSTPSFFLDLVTLESTAHVRFELLDDFALCDAIDNAQFGFSHLNRRLEVLQNAITNDMTGPKITENEQKSILDFLRKYAELSELANQLENTQLLSEREDEVLENQKDTIEVLCGLTPIDKSKKEDKRVPGDIGIVMDVCREAIVQIQNHLAIVAGK